MNDKGETLENILILVSEGRTYLDTTEVNIQLIMAAWYYTLVKLNGGKILSTMNAYKY
jgi:hypothetical protein